MDAVYLASWDPFTATSDKYARSPFSGENWLDLRGITSVALWSCYLVRIRKGKPQ